MGPDISSVVFQLPLEKLFGITRLSVFLLCQHCSISCSAECPLEPIYYRKDYLSILDIRIYQSYFEDFVKLENQELMFYLILKFISLLFIFYLNDLFVIYIYIYTVYILYVYCMCTLYMYCMHIICIRYTAYV